MRRIGTVPRHRRFLRAGGLLLQRLLVPSVRGSPVYGCQVNGRLWYVERFKPPPTRSWRATTDTEDGQQEVTAGTLDELGERLREHVAARAAHG